MLDFQTLYGDIICVCVCVGDVGNAGINRSPSAYEMNPEEERARYPTNVDTLMTLLKFVDGASGKSIGGFSWYATHGTSISKDNKLISGDNKGAAARFFEDWFASSTTQSPSHSFSTNYSSSPGKFFSFFNEEN